MQKVCLHTLWTGLSEFCFHGGFWKYSKIVFMAQSLGIFAMWLLKPHHALKLNMVNISNHWEALGWICKIALALVQPCRPFCNYATTFHISDFEQFTHNVAQVYGLRKVFLYRCYEIRIINSLPKINNLPVFTVSSHKLIIFSKELNYILGFSKRPSSQDIMKVLETPKLRPYQTNELDEGWDLIGYAGMYS